MFVKKIYNFDEDSGEADLIVSDGIYDVICFCSLFQYELQVMPKIKEIESFMCDRIMRVNDKNYLIDKKSYYSYHLQGRVLDIDKCIVSIGNIIVKLDKQMPKDIKNYEFIEFDVVRLDCYVYNC